MFQLLFGGQLTAEQQGPLADHAASCPSCHAVVEAMLTQHAAPPPPPPGARPFAIGAVVGGRFRVDQALGTGGMGIVVAATHLELGNRVAIKFMREDRLEAVAVERFIREARAVVKLRTEHVCRVFDVARLDTGAPYIVMELLDGVDLQRTIASRPLPATIAVEYVMQATLALAEAHAAGIVHRDLKPANLFVTRRHDGAPLVKVLDFGIAKALDESDARLTQTRVMLGSPGYMSPEQFDSPRDVDARTDIWALGVTLYQLLSGRLPFVGRNQTETAVKIAAMAPPPLEVDPRLAAVVMRCLEKSRDDRYADVAALAADLVPFGGPRARRIAARTSKAAAAEPATPTPGALPAVSPHTPVPALATQSTQATGAHAALGGAGGATLATGAHAFSNDTAAATMLVSRGSSPSQPPPRRANPVSQPPPSRAIPSSQPPPLRAMDASGASAPLLAAGSSAAHPQRTRRWQLAAAGLAGVVAAVSAAIIVSGLVHRDAAPAAPAAGSAGSAVVAAASAPTAPASPTPTPSAPAAPTPTPSTPTPTPSSPAPTPSTPSSPAPSAVPAAGAAPTPLSSLAAELKQTCEATLAPHPPSTVRPKTIVTCWCQPKDQPHAQVALSRVTNPRDREAVRRACAKQGIVLR